MSSSTDSPTSDEKRSGSKDRTNAARDPDSGVGGKLKALVWPEWAQEGVKSPRAWKTFARCMVAILATMVLLVDSNCALPWKI